MARRVLLAGACIMGASGAACPDDPDVDLCDQETSTNGAMRSQSLSTVTLLLAGVAAGGNHKLSSGALFLLAFGLKPISADAASASASGTCGSVKDLYKATGCCGNAAKAFPHQVVPNPPTKLFKNDNKNICNGKKPTASGFDNKACTVNNVVTALEQSGTNVTKGYRGSLNTSAVPITTTLFQAGLCPVNVHWHLGAEHLSVGQYDTQGTGPAQSGGRRLGSNVREGHKCRHYNANDAKFTTPYKWRHCSTDMQVGRTYEVHWPHSAGGACGTPYQYQTPFYDGVFCKTSANDLSAVLPTQSKIGVEGQVFTIVNDEAYYYPELFRGMIRDGDFGKDITKYTGSTTGTTRSNTMCSAYAPITWHVDRKCHLISASSFDKLCADMKQQADDMSGDLHAHGARELVPDKHAANNHQRLL